MFVSITIWILILVITAILVANLVLTSMAAVDLVRTSNQGEPHVDTAHAMATIVAVVSGVVIGLMVLVIGFIGCGSYVDHLIGSIFKAQKEGKISTLDVERFVNILSKASIMGIDKEMYE